MSCSPPHRHMALIGRNRWRMATGTMIGLVGTGLIAAITASGCEAGRTVLASSKVLYGRSRGSVRRPVVRVVHLIPDGEKNPWPG